MLCPPRRALVSRTGAARLLHSSYYSGVLAVRPKQTMALSTSSWCPRDHIQGQGTEEALAAFAPGVTKDRGRRVGKECPTAS
jgi:hypothetical protein